MSSYFKKPEPIHVAITVTRSNVMDEVVGILNKIAEARFDGQNTAYVNSLQPEIDFEQDRTIVYGLFEDGIGNIVRRIEPYVDSCGDNASSGATYNLSLIFPENWKSQMEDALKKKISEYLVNYIIAGWVEKVSLNDTAYSQDKAAAILRSIKGLCEMRQGKVHKTWNAPY